MECAAGQMRILTTCSFISLLPNIQCELEKTSTLIASRIITTCNYSLHFVSYVCRIASHSAFFLRLIITHFVISVSLYHLLLASRELTISFSVTMSLMNGLFFATSCRRSAKVLRSEVLQEYYTNNRTDFHLSTPWSLQQAI